MAKGQTTDAIWVTAVPVAAVALWAIYLRLRIDFDTGLSEVQEIGLPFAGFFDAFQGLAWTTR